MKKALLFLILLFSSVGIFAQESVKTTRIPTGYYAVSSFEGLRLRDKPELSAVKIGLLNYQETVRFISKDENIVTIDGIKSSWYEVESANGLRGYAFGGYLIPLYEVKLENIGTYKSDPVDMEFIEKNVEELLKENNVSKSVWELSDGLYSISSITMQTPSLNNINITGNGYDYKLDGVRHFYIKDGNLYIVFLSSWGNGVGSSKDCFFYNPKRTFKYFIPISDKENLFLLGTRERSGGLDANYLTYENQKLKYIDIGENMAFFEQVTYELEKDSTIASVNYDISFPWFINQSEIKAWSSSDVSGNPDLKLIGDMRFDESAGYKCGSLKDEAKKCFIELTDMQCISGNIFYEALYKGKKIWIKADSFMSSYKTTDAVMKAVNFQNGL